MPERKLGDSCKTCMYWERERDPMVGLDLGRCLRHAPRPNAADTLSVEPCEWPATYEESWCGEHEEAKDGE